MTDQHLTELDCAPCAESGVEAWFPTDEALELHIRAEHPDECAECEGYMAENRRDERNEPLAVQIGIGETNWDGWSSLGAVTQ